MKTVVISGANGFIGSQLVSYFHNNGWTVRALIHNPAKQQISGVEYYTYALGDIAEEKCFKDSDCFIHCAYAKNSYELNVKGTEHLLAMSRKCGVKKNIFISSLSSKEDALSIYGKQKWACEKLYNQPDDLILRFGMVLGNGGLFGQMKEYLKKKNNIPLISGGQQPIQSVYINDLLSVISTCIEKNSSGILSIASPEKISYKEFYIMLCQSLKTKPAFTSVPYSLLYFFLSISEKLRIKLPISRENLLGLKKQTYVDTSADLKRIGIELKSCRESLYELSAKA